MDLPRRFAEEIGALLGPDFPTDLGLAVSGGGDSMAMLHLAAGWARVYGVRLWPVTVDHGLRPEAAAECALVAGECKLLGLPHSVLRWEGWEGSGNLQDAARTARLDLIGRWRGGVRHVLFAHTRDDQAETFLMRLARGSGVEGLGGMAPLRQVPQADGAAIAGGPPPGPEMSVWWVVRPLLGVGRADLRHYLRVLRIPHADDPTNDDPAYDRVRMRRLLDVLEAEGIGRATLAGTADRMRRAAEALAARAADVASRTARVDHGDVVFDRDLLARVEPDTRLRLLAAALQFVASAPYRPRLAQLETATDRVLSGGAATLAGCRIAPEGAALRVFREHAAVADLTVPAGSPWDRRWRHLAPQAKGLQVRALGADGLAQAADAVRAMAVPRAALEAAPALWDGPRLVACARLRFGPDPGETLHPPGPGFPPMGAQVQTAD